MGFFTKLWGEKEQLPQLPDRDEDGAVILYSHLTGAAVPVTQMKDEVFTQNMLGKGHAIEPSLGILYSPVAGRVSAMYKTNHAICITSAEDIELLIHIGEDTVKLGGAHFTPLVKKGDSVAAGQPLMKFDIAAIKNAGYTVTTPVIVIDPDSYESVVFTDSGSVKRYDLFGKITLKC